MIYRSRSRRRSRSGTRRRKSWGYSRWGVTNANPSLTVDGQVGVWLQWLKVPAKAVNTYAPVDILEPEDWTLLRSLFFANARIFPRVATNNSSAYLLEMGAMVWEWHDDSFPAAADVPTLASAPDTYWYTSLTAYFNTGSQPSQYYDMNMTITPNTIESRARRKCSAYQGLLLCVNLTRIVGESSGLLNISWNVQNKMLFAEA